MLSKLSVPVRPTNLDDSRARAYCACSWCGWGLFGHFFLSSIISLFFLPLWETARYRLKYCLKGPLSPNQLTNHIAVVFYRIRVGKCIHFRFFSFILLLNAFLS